MNQRDFEQIKEQGRMARRAGKKRSANPYRIGTATDQYDAWLLGFDEADQSLARTRR